MNIMNIKLIKIKDFLAFKYMITPMLIQVIFAATLLLVLISAINAIIHKEFTTALFTLIFGPLCVRVICEIMMLLFSINDNLKEIKDKKIQ